ncbi:MAG: Uma2 family endonuclease [Prochlorothrix sp.]
MTLAAFLALPESDTALELINGQAIPKMSPKRFHSRLTVALYNLLSDQLGDRGEVAIEWAVSLQRQGQPWVPVPDLLYVSAEQLSPDWMEDTACPVAPALVIEIVSPGQAFSQIAEKAGDYLLAGVDRVWIVESAVASVTVLRQGEPPVVLRGDRAIEDDLFPDLQLTVRQIFQRAGLAP